MEFEDKLRVHINRFIFSKGYAPNVSQLAERLGITDSEVEGGLVKLAYNRAIVLHPRSFDIWVAHPFSLAPTLFWVECGWKGWWGNCAWCSLGIASLTREDTRIFTKGCGERSNLEIDIKDGEVVQKNLVVHFPIPAEKIWDNVIYSCSTMLVFNSNAHVVEWCGRHNISTGQIVPITQVWELAKLWYGNYLEDSWTRKSPSYGESIFAKAGLTGNFWKMTELNPTPY